MCVRDIKNVPEIWVRGLSGPSQYSPSPAGMNFKFSVLCLCVCGVVEGGRIIKDSAVSFSATQQILISGLDWWSSHGNWVEFVISHSKLICMMAWAKFHIIFTRKLLVCVYVLIFIYIIKAYIQFTAVCVRILISPCRYFNINWKYKLVDKRLG